MIPQKAQCSFRGDIKLPNVHFDRNNTSSFAVEKALNSAALEVAASEQRHIRHLGIKLAFSNEFYTNRNVIVRQLPLWNCQLIHPKRKFGQLSLNLYASKSAGNTYHASLNRHLINYGYHLTHAVLCFYIKNHTTSRTIVAVTVDDILVAASQDAEIKDIITTLCV